MKRQHAFLACGVACLATSFCFFVHAYIVVPLTARSAQTTTAAATPTPYPTNINASTRRIAKPTRSKEQVAKKLPAEEASESTGSQPVRTATPAPALAAAATPEPIPAPTPLPEPTPEPRRVSSYVQCQEEIMRETKKPFPTISRECRQQYEDYKRQHRQTYAQQEDYGDKQSQRQYDTSAERRRRQEEYERERKAERARREREAEERRKQQQIDNTMRGIQGIIREVKKRN